MSSPSPWLGAGSPGPQPPPHPRSPASGGIALLSDPLYPRLKQHLVESTGLAYYADKDSELAHRVGRRLAATGLTDCGAYFELLFDPLRGPAERAALIEEIAIAETYFFRHQEHFDALRDRVIPDLMSRNRLRHSLRIWCAGCADGCEPYSLAVLLNGEMADRLAGWDVGILGTDINQHSLARAREGRFAEWALRATPAELRHKCFSQEGSVWSLRPEYRKGVAFECHNLGGDPFPSLSNNHGSGFDLIVCRNVMIYFGMELMQRVVGQFRRYLGPGGWLLVGPAEPNMSCFTEFQAVNLPGLTLYQKLDEPEPAERPGAFAPPALPAPATPPARTAPATGTPVPPPPGRESADRTLARARGYADAGAWVEARRCCEELLAAEPLNARVHFYLGLILEQERRHEQAEQSFRRAIYLDRRSVVAHYYLGLVLQSRGEVRQASRCFENTLQLLGQVPAVHRFQDADGITAGELQGFAAMHLAVLREGTCDAPV